jgi:alpha-ketoglutarate-dependent dioxygenase alkB family protein 2
MEELFEEINNVNQQTNTDKLKLTCDIFGSPQDKLFLIYHKNFISYDTANKIFDILEQNIIYNPDHMSKVKIFGEEHEIPRKQVAYGEPGTFYNFSGTHVDAISWNQDSKLCKILLILKNVVSKQFNCNFNFVLINRYADGNDYIGFHADDEKDLQNDSPIVGLTFGAERDFQFKNIKSGKNYMFNKSNSLVLHHGSCISMQYPTNQFWKHSVPKRAKIKSPRISLTFRVMNI